MTFSKDVSKFIQRAQDKQRKFVVELVQDMMEDIIDQTPIDTGFARASWFTGINKIIEKEPKQSGTGPKGGPKFGDFEGLKAENIIALLKYAPGDRIYLSNSAPYIRDLEFGRANYKLKPPGRHGWVRGIVNNADSYAETVLQRINK
jgi:hypothetical protein